MQIDAHHHLWNYHPVKDSWITEDMHVIQKNFTSTELEQVLKNNGIDGSVAIQADSSEKENDFLVKCSTENDYIKGIVGWVDLTSDRAEDRLNFYKKTAAKIKGFRHIVQAEPDDFLLRKDFGNGIRLLQQYDFTYDLLIYASQLPAAVQFVEKFPGQKFVLDHIAKPGIKNGEITEWEKGIRQLAQNPDIYCKVSGMITEANWKNWSENDLKPYLDVVFDAFGTERLMFGSDWPVCLVAGTYQRVKQIITDYLSGYPQNEIDAVMGENAVLFYKL